MPLSKIVGWAMPTDLLQPPSLNSFGQIVKTPEYCIVSTVTLVANMNQNKEVRQLVGKTHPTIPPYLAIFP